VRHRPRLAPHRERHVGLHEDGEQVGSRLEHRLDPRAAVGADRLVGDKTAGRGADHAETDSDEHVAKMAVLPTAVEAGAEDCDDDPCLGPFAQEDDERREHLARGRDIRCT
jgi:hypothetical protein